MAMTGQPAARVVIVGAGPAGIRAAEQCVAAGLRPLVIDEAERAGGQIYRQPPPALQRPARQLYGSEAGKAKALHALFDRFLGEDLIDYLPRHTAIAVEPGKLYLVSPQGGRDTPYDRLILTTGATDRVAPLPGWQHGGVYTLGAAQIALKAQGVALGSRIVLAGSGPLLTLVAFQLRQSGAGLVAVLDTASFRNQLGGASGLAVRPVVLARGLGLRTALRGLYHSGVTLERIEAAEGGPVAMHWRDARGRSQRTACDTVALGWHLRSETQLAELAGCQFDYSAEWAQWLPRTDILGRATHHVYLAGDGLRPFGADAAEISGRIAARACLSDIGLSTPDPTVDLRHLDRLARFAHGIARAFPWPDAMIRHLPQDTMLCRCEGITVQDLRDSVALGAPEANRAKALSRVGMGRCQGRYCQLAAAEVIASTADIPLAEAGRLRAQAPAKPLPLSS
jgi:NADPH-dependent 2,4-dienoyl-CoA reductase/sulfur reductase-like enzyme